MMCEMKAMGLHSPDGCIWEKTPVHVRMHLQMLVRTMSELSSVFKLLKPCVLSHIQSLSAFRRSLVGFCQLCNVWRELANVVHYEELNFCNVFGHFDFAFLKVSWRWRVGLCVGRSARTLLASSLEKTVAPDSLAIISSTAGRMCFPYTHSHSDVSYLHFFQHG